MRRREIRLGALLAAFLVAASVRAADPPAVPTNAPSTGKAPASVPDVIMTGPSGTGANTGAIGATGTGPSTTTTTTTTSTVSTVIDANAGAVSHADWLAMEAAVRNATTPAARRQILEDFERRLAGSGGLSSAAFANWEELENLIEMVPTRHLRTELLKAAEKQFHSTLGTGNHLPPQPGGTGLPGGTGRVDGPRGVGPDGRPQTGRDGRDSGGGEEDPVLAQFNSLSFPSHKPSLDAAPGERARIRMLDDAPAAIPSAHYGSPPRASDGPTREEALSALKSIADKLGATDRAPGADAKFDLERMVATLNQGAKSSDEKISVDELKALPPDARAMIRNIVEARTAGTEPAARREPAQAGIVPGRPVDRERGVREVSAGDGVAAPASDGKLAVLFAPPGALQSALRTEKDLELSALARAKSTEGAKVKSTSVGLGEGSGAAGGAPGGLSGPGRAMEPAVRGGTLTLRSATSREDGLLARVVSAIKRRFGLGGSEEAVAEGHLSSEKPLPGTMETAMTMTPRARTGLAASLIRTAGEAMAPIAEAVPPLAILTIGWITISLLLLRRLHVFARALAWLRRRGVVAEPAAPAAPKKSYRKPPTTEESAITEVYASRKITDTVTASIGGS